MTAAKPSLRLVAISPDAAEWTISELTKALGLLAAAGVTALAYREKSQDPDSFLTGARTLRQACGDLGLSFILNERLELAEPTGAEIVHLTWKSPSLQVAKKTFGRNLVYGKSVHSLDEAQMAETEGFDYLFFGPIFPTPSKVGIVEARGLGELGRLTSISKIPVVAIGGIGVAEVPDIRATGAAGVAAIRVFFGDGQGSGPAAEMTRNWNR